MPSAMCVASDDKKQVYYSDIHGHLAACRGGEKSMNIRRQRNTRVGTLIVATIYLQLIKIDTCFEVLLSFTVVTSIVYNPLPAMWKS